MDLSKKLAALNYQRYADFNVPFTLDNARQAIYAFKGDVYDGLGVNNYNDQDIIYANEHLRIISGLYGLLRPLDLIQAYRLEMKTKFLNNKGKDFYAYWGNKITTKLNELLQSKDNNTLVNLASTEYFKVVNPKILRATIITPIFKEKKEATEKIVTLFVKRARGAMASYIIKNRINTIDGIKEFHENGYKFHESKSLDGQLVFVRESL